MSGYPSRRVFFTRVGEQPYGAWTWRRNRRWGVVFRVGPLGHVQFSTYRMHFWGSGKLDGRRGQHGVAVHWWGIRGRRRKRGVGLYMIL